MISKTNSLLLALWLILACTTAFATEQTAKVLTGANGLELQYLEDASGALTLFDVVDAEFTPVTTATLNFGFTKSSYWFRTTAQSLPGRSWVLDISYPPLEKLDVYHIAEDGIVTFRSGNLVAPNNRLIKDRTYAFPIEHSSGKTLDIFIRAESAGAMQVPITLWHSEAFHAHDHKEQIILGLFYGILLAAILYNLLLAITTREVVLLYYCFYVGSFSLFQLSINGLGAEYLWSTGSTFASRAIPLFMIATCVTAIVFIRSLLRLDQLNQKLDRIGIFLLTPLLISLVLITTIEYQILIKLLTTIAILTSLYVLYAGAAAYLKIRSYARYVVIGWCAFFAGVLVYGLKTFGVLPHNTLTEYALQAGSAIEVILFSFAIADRFIKLRDENIRIQQEATMNLEYRVTERTKELNSAVKQLAWANKKLESLNAHDTLSGVHSRSYFNDNFEQTWNHAIREGTELSLMMIDIDHFKSINDTHGHQAGDTVIVTVAHIISDLLKNTDDIVARYGGEEFVVLLPSTDLNTALDTAEHIRSSVSSVKVPHDEVTIQTTVSIGVAHDHPQPQTDRFTMIANADSALYEAKRGGRNQIKIWRGDDTDIRKAG